MIREFKINNLSDAPDKKLFLSKDRNAREIFLHRINQAVFPKNRTFYPDVVACSLEYGTAFDLLEEKVMSLDVFFKTNTIEKDKIVEINCSNLVRCTGDYYFFVYNTENYYHFLYDSLPYLLGFFELKAKKPNLKLLINYPNDQSTNTYKFFEELIELLGIQKDDIEFIKSGTVYENLFVSSSLTYGLNPNNPPRTEIHKIYQKLTSLTTKSTFELPNKFYVSRRSWLHGDLSNMGTNYTNRRVMENEDKLVESLAKKGYIEVFTEKMDTIEKINLFSNATNVVGAIGGGIANVLFSPKSTKLACIVSPTFLEVNSRFMFSLENVDVRYCNKTQHTEHGKFKTNMRVKFGNNLVGEIRNVFEDSIEVSYSEKKVAGWNSLIEYKSIRLSKIEVETLDNGLNSPWACDIDEVLGKCE